MIVIVDEDRSQMRPFALELEFRGYQVENMVDADTALRELRGRRDLQLVVVDVMLAADYSEIRSEFTAKETEDFKFTGLELATRLLATPDEYPSITAQNILIFTMATSAEAKGRINAWCKEHQVEYRAKSECSNPMEFGELVERKLAGR
jgi:CheY-like chemotaxis protein